MRKRYIPMGIALVALLALGGCAGQIRDRIETAHAFAAQEADEMAGLGLDIACHVPTDALLRWCESTDICRAIYYACPTVRDLMARMEAAMASSPPPPVADDASLPVPEN